MEASNDRASKSSARLAAREARKKKILENKSSRMTKVLGEYNKHHRESDDEDNGKYKAIKS